MTVRIGIDTGGTFTDVVRRQGQRLEVHKLPSTPGHPERAVLAGLAAVRRADGEAVDVVHGTTVGLNAVLTGSLARTVFVTNRGMEDLIEIGRQERSDLYAMAPHRPVPPVPRRLRIGVDCRRGAAGEVVEPLTAATIERTVAAVRRLAPEAVAIGLLHSPAAPVDERRLASALRRAMPRVPVTCSAELSPGFGEYERFSAAILNAAITPVVGGYTQRLQTDIGAGSLRLLRSSLGIMPPAEAAQFPARAMFSGPAGGVLAARQVARRFRMSRAAAFDMGGTSADVCLVEQNIAADATGSIAGLPLPLPSVPVHTVGCGGGSIAYVDAGGALRVGPISAGADPGPACYGRGSEPTVTDAHVVLGHLGAETLLGGTFPIDIDAAMRAIERLGRRLGLDAAHTARGVLTVADATMARAIMVITAERAIDPATVPLIAYGGAGGLHAAGLMERLGLPSAVMPNHPGAFSALGLALAGASVEVAAATRGVIGNRTLRRWITLGRTLLRQARSDCGRGATGRLEAMVRYRGQGAALRLPLDLALEQRFASEHRQRYGFVTDRSVEVVQVIARAQTRPQPVPPAATALTRRPESRRRPPVGGPSLRVLWRHGLEQGIVGPAILEETTATTLVPAGFKARNGPFGLLLNRHR